jgi:hypothetical protein
MHKRTLEKLMIKNLKIIIKELVFIKTNRIESPGPQWASYTRIYKHGPTARIVDAFGKMILEDFDTYKKVEAACTLLYDFGGYTSDGARDLFVTVINVKDFFKTYDVGANVNNRILKKAWKQVKKSELWKRATCDEILRL